MEEQIKQFAEQHNLGLSEAYQYFYNVLKNNEGDEFFEEGEKQSKTKGKKK